MKDADGKRPIFIIKRPVMAARHHGGAWKIAFADFMTAMFAFFLVMWLMSSSTSAQLQGIANEFKMPLKVALSGGTKNTNSKSAIPGGGDDPTRKEGEVQKSKSDIGTDASPTSSGEADDDDGKRLDQLKEQLENMIETSPVLKQFKLQLLIDITPEGLRMQIVDSDKRPMFDRSSAVLISYMRSILREIGPMLNAQPNKITLSGHTDATVYSQGDRSYSNWELSSDRANASRRELVAGGMEDKKVLRVIGVSSSINLNKQDPYAAINRRISIVVLNRQAQQDIETANSAGGVNAPAGPAQGSTNSQTAKPPVAGNISQRR